MRKAKPSKSELREMAVEAPCDERTILRVLSGGSARTWARRRALAVLRKHGWEVEPLTAGEKL